MFLVSQMSGLVENCNIRIFSCTINVINVKRFQLNVSCSYPFQLKLCQIVEYIKQIMNISLFSHTCSREIIDIFSWLEKSFNIAFSFNTVKLRSFKLCMIIILLAVYIVILALMTLTLFQGHRFVRNINCKLHVLDSFPLQFKCCMVATYIKKSMNNMIYMT